MRTKIYSAEEIFRLEFKGQANLVTPHIVEMGKIHPRVAYELSKGKVMEHVLWGVTFAGVTDVGETWRAVSPFSSCFQSRAAAEAHLLTVKNFVHPQAPKAFLRMFMLVILAMSGVACTDVAAQQPDIPEQERDCQLDRQQAEVALARVPPLADEFLALSQHPDAERELVLCGKLDAVVDQVERRVTALVDCRRLRDGPKGPDPALEEGLAAVRSVRKLCSTKPAVHRRQP